MTDFHKKLLLFDIDGTLITSGGAGKRAMIRAAEEVLQRPVRHDFLRFSGMTDRLILGDLIKGNGLEGAESEGLIDRMLEIYLEYLAKELGQNGQVRLHPGIVALLAAVSTPEFSCGLVTGNIEAGARLKLRPVGLEDFFRFGAFGDDSAVRNELPPLAVRRAEQLTGVKFAPEDVWIIGDTPRDIECGRANGYCTLAVATGGATFGELAAHHPDAVFRDLSDLSAVLAVFRR